MIELSAEHCAPPAITHEDITALQSAVVMIPWDLLTDDDGTPYVAFEPHGEAEGIQITPSPDRTSWQFVVMTGGECRAIAEAATIAELCSAGLSGLLRDAGAALT
jgi:hypothetical protein